MDEELYGQFSSDNLGKINSKDFSAWYYLSKERSEKIDVLLLEQMHDEYFTIVCQHYITNYLYSEQGKLNHLINMVHIQEKKRLILITCTWAIWEFLIIIEIPIMSFLLILMV